MDKNVNWNCFSSLSVYLFGACCVYIYNIICIYSYMYISRSVRVCVCLCVCWMYVYVHKTTEIVVSELWFLYTPKLRSLIWWVIFPSYPKYCWFIPSKKNCSDDPNKFWLVVWNICFHMLGISSSQLTFMFFRGVGQPPTRIKHVAIQGGTPKVATLLSVYTSTWWSSFYWSIGPNNLL
jgi:hypothetical protein